MTKKYQIIRKHRVNADISTNFSSFVTIVKGGKARATYQLTGDDYFWFTNNEFIETQEVVEIKND
tara:strand:- start:775 stop:969 length:195 start_codon:yes stop_codon:yes gene_type:complete